MDKKTLISNANQCKNKTIIVIGDIMLDEFHWCEVSRISPEAPVPVCRVKETTLVPGGAANVASNIASLGFTAKLTGLLGTDSSGQKLSDTLHNAGVDTDSLVQIEDKPTILKSRIIAHQQQVARVDREDASHLTPKQQKLLLNQIKFYLPHAQAVILSDYLKGTLTPSLCQNIIKQARSLNIPVIVDPKGDDYSKYKGATLLTPNFSEFEAIIKKKCQTEEEIEKEALKLIKRLKLDCLLVTRSEKGMSLISPSEKYDIETKAREVYDITGAGDTVIATLSSAIASKVPLKNAAHLANYGAGIVVGKLGTATTTFKEIKAIIENE